MAFSVDRNFGSAGDRNLTIGISSTPASSAVPPSVWVNACSSSFQQRVMMRS